MKLFLLGFSLIYLIATIACLATDPAVRINNPWVLSFALSVFVVPVACAWACVELVRLLRRPRILEPVASSRIARFFRGLLAGLLGLILLTGLLLYGEANYRMRWDNYYLTVITAAPAALIGTLLSRRVRSGTCPQCRYDLSGITIASQGKCPECGNMLQHTLT